MHTADNSQHVAAVVFCSTKIALEFMECHHLFAAILSELHEAPFGVRSFLFFLALKCSLSCCLLEMRQFVSMDVCDVLIDTMDDHV